MELTLELLDKIPAGEIFRVVTTQYQTVQHSAGELTFVCKKGHGYNDWAIYYHFSNHPVHYIKEHGEKVTLESHIRNICPCTDEVFYKYRY